MKNRISPAIAALVILLFSSNMTNAAEFLDQASSPSPIKGKNNVSAHALQDTFRDIYDMYKDSVVFISTEKTVKERYINPFQDDPFFQRFFGQPAQPRSRKLRGLGTGFIISADGYICTNHHVIQNMDTVTVTVNNTEYNARVVGSDPLVDIALLKIERKGGAFKPVHLGNSDNVRIGDLAIAIGNPFGLEKTYTFGIVSATGRNQLDELGNAHIQTDASINQGNSGGPLINIDGEVIGVNRAIFSQTGGSIGIGFALPINAARDTLIELQKYGRVKRGYIGVQIAPLSEDLARQLGIKNNDGALIAGLVQNGPAAKAGLQVRDVIVAVDDTEIKDYQELLKTISKMKIGTTIKVTIWREGERRNHWVTIMERPVSKNIE